MTRKRVVWKNDELRWKNIESTRDVTEELRHDVRRNSAEWNKSVLERQRHEMLRCGTGLSRKGNEVTRSVLKSGGIVLQRIVTA